MNFIYSKEVVNVNNAKRLQGCDNTKMLTGTKYFPLLIPPKHKFQYIGIILIRNTVDCY